MTEQEFEKAKRINKDIQKLFDRVKEKNIQGQAREINKLYEKIMDKSAELSDLMK